MKANGGTAAAKEPLMSSILTDLGRVRDRTGALVEELNNRLSVVCMPKSKEAPDKEKIPSPQELPPLHAELVMNINHLRRFADLLEDILERLEV